MNRHLDDIEIKRLYEDNVSGAAIAKQLNCTTATIYYHFKKMGLVRRHGHAREGTSLKQRVKRNDYKGKGWPRRPCEFSYMFPADKCGWIRCPDPTATSSRWDVDHNHNCTRHGNKSYAIGDRPMACGYCVRAYVHHACNETIKFWEWAQKEGLPIPDDVAAYLAIGI